MGAQEYWGVVLPDATPPHNSTPVALFQYSDQARAWTHRNYLHQRTAVKRFVIAVDFLAGVPRVMASRIGWPDEGDA